MNELDEEERGILDLDAAPAAVLVVRMVASGESVDKSDLVKTTYVFECIW